MGVVLRCLQVAFFHAFPGFTDCGSGPAISSSTDTAVQNAGFLPLRRVPDRLRFQHKRKQALPFGGGACFLFVWGEFHHNRYIRSGHTSGDQITNPSFPVLHTCLYLLNRTALVPFCTGSRLFFQAADRDALPMTQGRKGFGFFGGQIHELHDFLPRKIVVTIEGINARRHNANPFFPRQPVF